MRRLKAAIILFMLMSISLASAQDSCSIFVAEALATIDNFCEATERNELCYGNYTLSVNTFGSEVNFSQPADIISILDIESIQSSPYSEPDEWGVALMQVQANIADALPEKNVAFLLFGEVNLTHIVSSSPVSLSARTTANINIRSGSSTTQAVVGSLSGNTEIELIGRNAAGNWVYFVTENISGWVFVSLLQIEGDVMALDEVADDFSGTFSIIPMQAIYFSSGIGEANCQDMPQDGILIQAPEYEEAVKLIVNDVEIKLTSTVYLQAQAGNEMRIYVLEGQIDVTAFDVTRTVPQGALIRIPIDEQLKASDRPNIPEPYLFEDLETLPIAELPQVISISEAASTNRIQYLNECHGSIKGIVNMRGGPGTRYPVIEALDETSSPTIVEQATGSDGFVWYNLSAVIELWVRSDLITLDSDCSAIPIKHHIPPLPTSDPSGNWLPFNLYSCWGTLNRPIYTGMYIQFAYGCCAQATAAENDAMRGGNNGWITLDGVPMDVHYTPSRLMSEGFYISDITATWTATAGTHTIAAGWPAAQHESACTFTVQSR